MLVVAVRNIETKKLLGFFWAGNHDDLWWTIDEIAEPSHYEWTRMSYGGLHYPDEERDMSDIIQDGAKELDESPEEDHDYSLSGLHLSEGTWENLQEAQWTRFDFADEGHGGIATIARDIERRKATEREALKAKVRGKV